MGEFYYDLQYEPDNGHCDAPPTRSIELQTFFSKVELQTALQITNYKVTNYKLQRLS